MTPTNEDFKMFIGNTKRLRFALIGLKDMSEVDSIVWKVVPSNNQSEEVIRKEYPTDIDIKVDGDIHLITLVLEPIDTADLEPRKYIHELLIQDTDSTVDFYSTASRGSLRLIKSII